MILACSKVKNDEYIAKVGDQYLNKEQLLRMIPESKKISSMDKNYLNSIISKWVKNEVLYQNAKKYHFDRDQNLKYKAEKYFRDLVIDKYMEYNFQNNIDFSEKQLKIFYNQNKELYKRDSKAAKVKHFFTEKYDIAKKVKNIISSGNSNYEDKLDTSYTFTVQYIQSGECIEEINELIFKNRPLKYYGPVVSDFGYHVIEVLERYDAGSYKSFSQVREDIYKRLVHIKIMKNYVTFVDSLKNQADWKIDHKRLNKIAGELW